MPNASILSLIRKLRYESPVTTAMLSRLTDLTEMAVAEIVNVLNCHHELPPNRTRSYIDHRRANINNARIWDCDIWYSFFFQFQFRSDHERVRLEWTEVASAFRATFTYCRHHSFYKHNLHIRWSFVSEQASFFTSIEISCYSDNLEVGQILLRYLGSSCSIVEEAE